jgi:hypothetical protein
VNGGGVGANGPLTRGSNGLSPGTKYKRSKIAFAVTSIALSLVPLGTKLLELPAQFLIGSPGTLGGVGYFSNERGFFLFLSFLGSHGIQFTTHFIEIFVAETIVVL